MSRPGYEMFALGVSEDADVLAFLESLPRSKRQPNLLFGAVKYLTGVLPEYGAFRAFVLAYPEDLRLFDCPLSPDTSGCDVREWKRAGSSSSRTDAAFLRKTCLKAKS